VKSLSFDVVLMFVLVLSATAAYGQTAPAAAPAATSAATQDATAPAATPAPADAAPDVTGKWELSWKDANGDPRHATAQMKQSGKKLSGSFVAQRGSVALKGTVTGKQVAFGVKVRRRTFGFTGTVDGDSMSGTTEQGTAWMAARQ
jgi:hypothetical protein